MTQQIMAALVASSVLLSGGSALADGKLQEVKQRGTLRCATHNGSIPGFAEISDKGTWRGFDIDMCRTLATAIFGSDENHIQFVPTSWAQRWPLLQSGELDVLMKQTGWTQSRDTELGFNFSRPYVLGTFHVLAHKGLGTKIADLNGGTVCSPAGSSNERYIAGFIKTHDLDIKVVSFDKWEEMLSAYYDNRCDGIVSTGVSLAVSKMNAAKPEEHVLLEDVIGIEAQSWVVKQGDDQWLDIANWVLTALWFAEEQGITSQNVDEVRAEPKSPEVAKLLGVTPGVGTRLGLTDDWAYNVIKLHGNYGEIWNRNIGDGSPFKLERSLNALWKNGGVHYSLNFD